MQFANNSDEQPFSFLIDLSLLTDIFAHQI